MKEHRLKVLVHRDLEEVKVALVIKELNLKVHRDSKEIRETKACKDGKVILVS